MKILVLCDQGNNRSVTLAGQLKYLGNDVLSAGLVTNETATLAMLLHWADKVILTAYDQMESLKRKIEPGEFYAPLLTPSIPVEVWNIGPDIYKRPYNKDLLAIVKDLIKEHPDVDCRST